MTLHIDEPREQSEEKGEEMKPPLRTAPDKDRGAYEVREQGVKANEGEEELRIILKRHINDWIEVVLIWT